MTYFLVYLGLLALVLAFNYGAGIVSSPNKR